ncbi:hypothetical protein GS429_08430 [Natronorubrum sp. JWXQ-INN-674]|uniref:Uncharacterized protein n=1 Tax=Natronorubrum halalkaliphilum TaxID=2691917 RepID=A0A6B0VM39_9EURY|nr:hypothetical protein [Natronorubrum halalkaliphilum]MXV62086.1 hypothetical protein [Natronorubrum halalkaliphilum]
MQRTRVAIALAVIVCFLAAASAGVAGTTTNGSDWNSTDAEPLVDDGEYWKGDVLYNETLFGPNETVTITNLVGEGQDEVNTTGDGELWIDTRALNLSEEGVYSVEGNDVTVNFFYSVEEISIRGADTRYVSDGGDSIEYDLSVSSNRDSTDAIFDADQDLLDTLLSDANTTELEDGTVRVDEFGGVSESILIDDLDAPQYYLEVESADGIASESALLDVADPNETTYRVDREDVVLDTGDTFWEGHTAHYTINEVTNSSEVINPDGEVVTAFREGTENATVSIANTPGITTNESESELNAWELRSIYSNESETLFYSQQQHLSSSVTKDHLGADGETELTVESNRDGYDLNLWADGLSAEELLNAMPNATEQDGNIVIENASAEESMALEFDGIDADGGNHTIYTTPVDISGAVSTTITLEAPDEEDEEEEEDDGGNGGGGFVPPSPGDGPDDEDDTDETEEDEGEEEKVETEDDENASVEENDDEDQDETEIEEEDSDEDGDADQDDDAQPAFGAVAAILALLLVGLVLRSP